MPVTWALDPRMLLICFVLFIIIWVIWAVAMVLDAAETKRQALQNTLTSELIEEDKD